MLFSVICFGILYFMISQLRVVPPCVHLFALPLLANVTETGMSVVAFFISLYIPSLSPSLSHTHTHTQSFSYIQSLSLSLSLSLFFSLHTHTHTNTHTHTHKHTLPHPHTHTHTPKHTYAHTYTCTNTRACKNIRVQYVRTHTRTTYMRIFLTRVLFVNARLFDTHLFHVCFFVFPIRPFSIRYSTHENGYIT